MATIIEVKALIAKELEDLKAMSAEQYCADKVAEIYAKFNAEKDERIAKLEATLETLQEAEDKIFAEQEQEQENVEPQEA